MRAPAPGTILYTVDRYTVRAAAGGWFAVFRDGVTAAERVALIGPGPRHGLRRAKAEANIRAAREAVARLRGEEV